MSSDDSTAKKTLKTKKKFLVAKKKNRKKIKKITLILSLFVSTIRLWPHWSIAFKILKQEILELFQPLDTGHAAALHSRVQSTGFST